MKSILFYDSCKEIIARKEVGYASRRRRELDINQNCNISASWGIRFWSRIILRVDGR